MLQLHTAYAALMEARMKVKDLIALLQKEDPEAVVIKYNDGGLGCSRQPCLARPFKRRS
jgi:hypothetical protein